MINEELIIDGKKFQLIGVPNSDGEIFLSCDIEVWWRGELADLQKAIYECGKANTITCHKSDIPFIRAMFEVSHV